MVILMSIYTIKNDKFTAKVDTLGAQIISLEDAQGRELLWTGDPAYWREHAPVLFPIVGALRENRTEIKGQWFEMARHGFAKHKEFALERKGEREIFLRLRADEETKKAYPFSFSLTVEYALADDGFSTFFTVENTGEEPLPFAIGGHPGFNLPLEEGAEFEDYTLCFEQEEDQQCPTVRMDTGLLDYEAPGFALKGREIPLRHSLFYRDALVFSGLNSHKASIVNKKTGRGIEMDFSGFPMLGVWSAQNDGPYVCLEPWTGCATLTTESDKFTEKKGMLCLSPGEKTERRFIVRVL